MQSNSRASNEGYANGALGLSGSPGSAWDLTIDEDGTSFANWSAIDGTWSSSGGNIQNTDNAAALKSAYLTTPKAPLGNCIIEFEVQFPTSGQGSAPNYAGVLPGTPNPPPVGQILAWVQRDTTPANSYIAVTAIGSSPAYTFTVTINLDVWYTVRVIVTGSTISLYLDGTLLGTVKANHAASVDLTYFALVGYSSKAFWRNIKVWTPSQP